jgi:phosphoribosyl 1,2-cyclic phosphate phosphodiesterase
MKVKFIGTAASEGFPAPFCQCGSCESARKLKGKNLRRRSSILINENIMIDFGPDSYSASLSGLVNLSLIKHIVFTHSHTDHLYLKELFNLFHPMSLENNNFPIHIYGNQTVISTVKSFLDSKNRQEEMDKRIVFITIQPFDIFDVEDLRFQALLANHADENEDALVYSITENDKKVFYGTDSGIYPNETIEHLRNHPHDCYIFDCTACDKHSPYPTHMGFPEIISVMKEINIYKNKNMKVFTTHFAHTFDVVHEDMVKAGEQHHIVPAYDGLEIMF